MYRQALVLVIVLLTGCSIIEKQNEAEKKQDKAEQSGAAAAEAAIDDTKCQSFGYKRNTPAYAQCRKDYEDSHKQLGISLD
jgi:hypothetical protein